MKPTVLIPPVAALVAAGSWLASQRHSISTLEEDSTLLRQRITAAHTASAGEDPTHASKPAADKSKAPVDWKKTAAQMQEMLSGGGMGDMREMIRMQQYVNSMTQQELIAALDEVATLDLTPAARAAVEQILVGPLVEKDPELALDRFSHRLKDEQSRISWELASALGKWAEKDPVKATAWLDQQIAAGNFDSKTLDGKSRPRVQFEGRLVCALLGQDPGGAGQRLTNLPEDQRAEALRSFSSFQMKDENQKAFGDLVRRNIAKNEQPGVISEFASNLASKGYPEVTAYLGRIAATPDERKASVEQAAISKIRQTAYQKPVSFEEIDNMRAWAETQAPGSADAATGKALASAGQGNKKFKFADAAALAVKYHEASGNDEVLVNFLDGWEARQHKEETTALAEKISDPKRREEILKNLK